MRFIRVEDNEISLSCGLSVLKTTRSRWHAVYPCWWQRDLVVMRFIRVEDNEISLSRGLSVLKTKRSRCHAVYPCWRQRDLVVMRFIRVEGNEISLSCGLSVLKITRSRCHAVYPCWRQRDLVESSEYVPQLMILPCILFPHYIYLWPEDGPRWPKHVVSLIKQIQRQLCFDVPTPSKFA